MEESDDNLSAEDINNTKSPAVKSKPKKRSLVERELETSLTARVISPISAGDGCSTSRYGRARRQKNENSESDKAAKMLKSPKTEISPKSKIQSPVYKMHASNSPIKLNSQRPFESQIENINSENNSLSRFCSAEKKISPSKRYPKVYIRKDLIQLKDKDKEAEETVVLIKNMFSPAKSAQTSNRSSLERSLEKPGKRKLSSKDMQSVVKTLDFDEKDIKKEDDKKKQDTGKMGLSKSEIFEIEAKSEYQVGDLAWARMGTYPFWPCIITREPGSGLFVKTKLFGRTVRNMLNVTFFGDNGRRSWIADSMLRPFLGQLEFETTRAHFTLEAKKKDPKLYTAFFISERKMPQWLLSVEEAETLLREPKRLRIDILSSMLMKVRPEKMTPRSDKGKRVTRTDSDVSLSESLYDTLFSEDDTKGSDSDRRNKGKQSLDVSEVVTACLDNMAARTGITKIQKQSHMDRWLLKAKTKTPEKSQLKSQAVQKATKSSAKTHKPNISQKPYRFRSRHNESQSSDSSILNDHSEASTSSDYKSVSVSYDDVLIENSNERLHNDVTDIVSDNISATNDSNKKVLDGDISIFKSPLSETEKKVIKERKNVLNKIKQSIDSDENMPSTSSVDISGMSTSFEISSVDAQSSDKESVDSDVNENVSEITHGKISHLNVNIYDIDKIGPITSSPKNSITDIEVSTGVLNDGHEKEDDKSVDEISTSDKLISNEWTNIESIGKNNDSTKNVSNDNVSDLNIEKMQENTCMNTIIEKSNKFVIEKENESIVNKKPDVRLDKDINICNVGHQEVTENNSNFRMDRKIKTRQKTVDTVVTELIESKGSCKDEKSNVCELNTPNTRSKKLRISNVNIDLGLDKLKLNKTERIYNEITQKIPKTSVSQNESNVNEYNELKQSFDNSIHVEILHKSTIDIGSNDVSRINREQKSKEKHKGLLLENKQKEISNEGTLKSKEYNRYSEAISGNGTLIISETKLKENDSSTSPKYALSEAKCEVSASIDNSPAKDNRQNDLKLAYNNAAFQKYLELKQDNVIDEHPELSQEEITSYLYKTWQYETKDIIDNKLTGEFNKTPAKGTNYKALDKERGRKKLIRKKPADFTQNVILPPIHKSPVNGYHKEIKPIIISPKNKIIFLPKKSITESVKNNINFSDFKFGNTSIIDKVQTPRMENKVSISSVGSDNISIVETITDTKTESAELPSVTKVENANSNRNNIKTPENENKFSISQNITVLKNDSNAGEKSIFVPQSHKIQKSENFPGTIAADNNKNLSHTENKVSVSQNGSENVTTTKLDGFEPTTNNTGANDQKLTHDHDGQAIESKVTKVPASNSITKTMQTTQNILMSTKNYNLSPTASITENTAINIKEKKPNIVNNVEDTKCFEKKPLSLEKNKFKVTEVLSNGSLTKTKQHKLKITLTRSNLLEKIVTPCSALNETEKPSIKAPNNILPNENDDGLSPNKTANAFENENELQCLIKTSIAAGEENIKPLNTPVHRKAIEVTQINKDVERKENIIKEKVSLTHEKECVDNSIEYDKKYSKLGEGENVLKKSFKNQNETVLSNLRNTESDSTTLNTTFNLDTEEQNITLEKNIVSFSNKNTSSMKNDETESVTRDGLTEIINSNCSSSKEDVENVVRENPEFQKYLELKQDSVIDEHTELSQDQVIQYLYKTWLYEENNKPEKKKTYEVDQINLVKGISTINVDKDKKRKKLNKKRPSDSTDIKKKQPTIINQFFKHNGFQEQFEKSVNTKTEFQAMESSSEIESQQGRKVTISDCKSPQSGNVTVSDCKRHDTDVKNIDQKPNTIQSSTVIESEKLNDQNSNESTEYEPEENNDEKLKSKEIANDSDNFDTASSSSTDCESKMRLSTRKQKRKQKGTQEENNKALMKPEFVRYLDLRQDSVIDEHPELSHEEVIQYLYKTWLYEEGNKSEKKITDEIDQTSLVKGVSSIYADKRRKKLSRRRSSDTSDAKKKPPTIINKLLMQNGYHEYHEKSLVADDKEISTLNTQSHYQNLNKKEPETYNDDKSLNEEIISADKFDSGSTSSDSEFEMSLSEKKRIWKEKQKLKKRTQVEKSNALMDAEFVRYLELRQDYVMDEHPELTEEEITNYLYKTWLYEENIKNDKKRDDEVDQTSLVKGVDSEPKKPKRKYKIIKEDSQESFKVSEVFEVEPKEKSKRSTARPYYNEDISDIEEELALFEIFRKKKPNKPNVEQQIDTSQPTQEVDLTHNMEEISNIEDYVYDEMDMVEIYFEQLTTPKPNVFKGLVRERVCEICEKVTNLVKCKTCHGMFHTACVKNHYKTQTEEKTPNRGRKKKKKYQRRIKNSDETFMDDDGHSDEKTQDGNSDPNLSIESEREPIVADAEYFEAKASAKMREILGDLDNVQYDYESTNVAISWNARPGKCQIVDVKLEIKRPEEVTDASNFKCNDCEKFDTPKCFVCKSPVSPKEYVGYRQKCQVAHCYKYYHLECLAHWPQTQFNGGDVRNKSKEGFEAMSCPRHVCHTCVSDDPRGCKTRFSGDKLARCVRCPATYHSFTKCLPAGSQILTGSQIICPRHYEHRPGKVPCHVNTGWCFICALGGTLICCEYCPTSFHAECLNIDPPEGGYMCEDCETGRLPLYGEMVWVKLGHYRWWPGIILHPSQIPTNIMAVKHSQGEFVVRFFGQYDHYWVNRGRVFPFQEGDTGKISSQKSKIDSAFTLAVEHASRACEILKNAIPNDEESQDIASSLLPPHYVKLKVNKPVGSLVNRRIDIEESSLTQCECDPCDVVPCGPYSQCLNRMLLTECGPTCRAGERCNNRAFEKRQYPKMAPYRTPHRGWGLRCLEDIKAGQFVIEYVGELLDEAEFQRRMRRKHEVRDENFYFLTLDKERMIDAGPKGNLARFMNHSCEPNCETQKWTVLGDIRVGLFAIDDIPANSELTFNYNLESAGIEKKQCMCGAKRCSGYIGAKPKQGDPHPKKSKIVKKTNKKTKKTESSQQKRPRGRPCKPKELTEIEKDLLIIKNATNVSEKDIVASKNSSVSSDSEHSERCSVDSKEGKGVKRKRGSQDSLTLCLKRVKTQDGDEFRID